MASSTVTAESVIITVAVDAHGGHNVAISGIPIEYLDTEMDDEVIILLEWSLDEMIANMW